MSEEPVVREVPPIVIHSDDISFGGSDQFEAPDHVDVILIDGAVLNHLDGRRSLSGETIFVIDLLSAGQAMDTFDDPIVIDPVQNEYAPLKSERGRPKHAFRTKPPVRRTGMRRK